MPGKAGGGRPPRARRRLTRPHAAGTRIRTALGTGTIQTLGARRSARAEGVNYYVAWEDRPGVTHTWIWHNEILEVLARPPKAPKTSQTPKPSR